MYEVTISRSFSAAHTLREIGGKCEELHGHNFKVEVTVVAERLNPEGLVLDFRHLKGWTDEALAMLDHKHLNELPSFQIDNPSSENLARFIYGAIAAKVESRGLQVKQVTVWESDDARATYRPDITMPAKTL